MKIHPIIAHNPLQNIFYILEYGDKQALIIDPCDSILAQDFLDTHNLELQRILITHEHYDHYDGVAGLDCDEVYAGKTAAENMPITASYIFDDGEIVFEHDDIQIKAIFTPGHAAGHMIFELSEVKSVGNAGMRSESVGNEDLRSNVTTIFSGDVLFSGGVGHTRRGSNEDLYNSIQKFKKYPDDVIIYSGHDYLETNIEFLKQYTPENILEIQKVEEIAGGPLYFTSLGEERKYNPFLTVGRDEFIRLRELRNNF